MTEDNSRITTDSRPESLGWQEKNVPAGGYVV